MLCHRRRVGLCTQKYALYYAVLCPRYSTVGTKFHCIKYLRCRVQIPVLYYVLRTLRVYALSNPCNFSILVVDLGESLLGNHWRGSDFHSARTEYQVTGSYVPASCFNQLPDSIPPTYQPFYEQTIPNASFSITQLACRALPGLARSLRRLSNTQSQSQIFSLPHPCSGSVCLVAWFLEL